MIQSVECFRPRAYVPPSMFGDVHVVWDSHLLTSCCMNRRGLSRYYQGRSQTFTSLSDVKCLEDLAKPERPQRKKMKSCRSYVWGLDNQKPLSPKQCSKTITKKASKSSLSCIGGRRHNFVSGRPAIPPHRSSNFSGQSLLLAWSIGCTV